MYLLKRATSYRAAAILGALVALCVILIIGFSIMYAGKIYPGVRVNGTYMGGLSKADAQKQMTLAANRYSSDEIPLKYHNVTLRIPVSSLKVQYGESAIAAAAEYGREGNPFVQLRDRVRALVGGSTAYGAYTFDDSGLSQVLNDVDNDVTVPVTNARLAYKDDEISVASSHPGIRFDRGRAVMSLRDRLEKMSTSEIDAPVYSVTPSIDTASLEAVKTQANAYVSNPLTISAGSTNESISQSTIVNWIDVTTPAGRTDMAQSSLTSFYQKTQLTVIRITLDNAKISAYVGTLAAKLNRDPQNAVLAMQNGALAVTQASHDGVKLNEIKAAEQITAALKNGANKNVTLAADVKPAEVSEKNLDSLGIKDLISEGQTFFPGSSADRMTNVRVGAAIYNGVLLKPGETFSFGKILGDVGPAQGYVPELVILGNHEEKQYGGGLCQVASTAYRAALLAGLPILERHNHSFAVSFYTAPYGVPGVDATIYYPQVDFKFKNDTGHYMLIQTKMQGTTLTFDYYGTKTKTGEIRGPQFISGTTDATQPSHTVFWRDIKDLSGNVTKTDQIDTYYQPSTSFPIQKQFN